MTQFDYKLRGDHAYRLNEGAWIEVGVHMLYVAREPDGRVRIVLHSGPSDALESCDQMFLPRRDDDHHRDIKSSAVLIRSEDDR